MWGAEQWWLGVDLQVDRCDQYLAVHGDGVMHNYAVACFDSKRNRIVRMPDNRNDPIKGEYWSC